MPSRKLSFQGVESEEEFLQVLKAALQHPKAPDALFPLFYDFYQNYKSESCHHLQLAVTIYA